MQHTRNTHTGMNLNLKSPTPPPPTPHTPIKWFSRWIQDNLSAFTDHFFLYPRNPAKDFHLRPTTSFLSSIKLPADIILNCAAAAAAASKSFGSAGVCCWPCGRRCRWSHPMSNEKIKKRKKVINDEFIRIDGMSIRQLSQCQKPCINDHHLAWCISVYRCGWVEGVRKSHLGAKETWKKEIKTSNVWKILPIATHYSYSHIVSCGRLESRRNNERRAKLEWSALALSSGRFVILATAKKMKRQHVWD